MKILIFVPNFVLNVSGHVPVFFQNRINSYLEQGHKVDVLTFSFTGEKECSFLHEQLNIFIIKKKKTYNFLKKFINQYDIFYVHFINFRICKFLLLYNCNATIVFHGVEAISAKRYYFDFHKKPFFFIKKIIYNYINFYFLKKLFKKKNIKLIFVSQWLLDIISKDLNYNFSKSQKTIIPNSVNNFFLESKKEFKILKSEKIKVIVIKNFDSYKYAGDLTLKFILEYSKTNYFSNFEFLIYGNGLILDKFYKKLLCLKNVKIIKNYLLNLDLAKIYHEQHIFLYLTRLDAQSLSVSEALSAGMVVVSSNVAAMPEFITNNYNGILIDNNYLSFKENFDLIATNKKNLALLSKNAAYSAKNIFSSNINCKKEIEFSIKKIICKNCLMDNSTSDIYFDENLVCSYCIKFIPLLDSIKVENSKTDKLGLLFNIIKEHRPRQLYDSLIGVSGGVDSSYVVHLAKTNNLNPLLVHFDNGWNSETSISNINKLINKTNFDLKTVVMNWEEFRDIQLSFLKAGVIDIELPTDHAIFANLLNIAKKYKIKNILSGTNIFTEHAMPLDWMWRKTDFKNIADIHKKNGSIKIKNFPRMKFFNWYFAQYGMSQYKIHEPLNCINYTKKNAVEILKKNYDWKNYSEKHYESIFTKFYQSFILPKKFKIDKRTVHYSSLIRNNELSRDEAKSQISKKIITHEDDIEYVARKFSISKEELLKIINQPPSSHYEYKNSEFIFNIFKFIYTTLK
jgi:N-acetyl sugar amidotransferase